MTDPKPTPGSPEAIALGCKCPRVDNGHGKRDDGRFVFSTECPVHWAVDRNGTDWSQSG